MTLEGEAGGVQPPAQRGHRPGMPGAPEAGRGGKDPPPAPSKEGSPAHTLIMVFRPPDGGRAIPVALSPLVCGILLQPPQDTDPGPERGSTLPQATNFSPHPHVLPLQARAPAP